MNARRSIRRRILTGLALLAICIAATVPSVRPPNAAAGANNWTPMTLPYAMNITAVAVAPSYPCDKLVFMTTDGHGVFRAADSGGDALWVGINNGLSDLGVLALAVSPNYGRCDRLTDRGDRTIFIGARSGVFRTVNGGASWEPRTLGLPANLPVQSVSISPNYASDRTVFAGYEGSLFRSVDGGTTWQPFDSGLTDRTVQAFAVSANYANDSTMFVGTRFSGIYRIAANLQDSGAALPATPTPAIPSS
ncbi:MAG: hypothetical protein NTZ05_15220 [Chloroflexi bacterium]|nr:hypothetical protein [Chloroflexota bacterium]